MKTRSCLFLLLGLVAAAMLGAADGAKEASSDRIAGFTLKDTGGGDVSLSDFKDKKAVVVVFIGTECPINNYYMRTFRELHDEFGSKGVQFLAINSNSQDPSEKVADHAKTHGLPFPVLKDTDHHVAGLFKAERTPEVFVLDEQRVVRYRGRIDDQYGIGYQRPQPTRRDLAEALNELLAGKSITKPRTEVAGCVIGRSKKAKTAATVTYSNQVVRILQKHCQECHRPGQIGPFSLLTYEKARGWADTIREVVTDGRMPPWPADPGYLKFSNDRRLPKEDKETLLAWIDEGCPKGDDKDLPPPKRWVEGWAIGKPDMVFTMQEEFTVPAKSPKNGIPYKYFFVPTNFKEDTWIQAAEARPGNRSVVHHIIMFYREPGKRYEPGEDRIGNNFITGVAPGDMPLILAPGLARKIPKGAVLGFQMHYTPNGVEGKDRSSIGFIFCKEPPQHNVRTRAVLQMRFAIPPGAPNHPVVAKTKWDRDAVILGFMPHMHVRGKSFEYKLIYPDGKEEIVLSVPKFDFGWQQAYRLEKRIHIPAGTQMVCTAHYDNSPNNPSNPDPTKTIRWGDQTWEEMMIGWLDYYYLDEKPEPELAASKPSPAKQ